VSGPILDRFDLRVDVAAPDVADLVSVVPGESTATVAERVAAARGLAARRGLRCNSEIPGPRLDDLAPMSDAAGRLLESALREGRLTGRGLHRVRRVALTVADLAGRDGPLGIEQVATALQLRSVPTAFESHAEVSRGA
jgi:magnesium chelatase family protein